MKYTLEELKELAEEYNGETMHEGIVADVAFNDKPYEALRAVANEPALEHLVTTFITDFITYLEHRE
jgi:hypothetical protein